MKNFLASLEFSLVLVTQTNSKSEWMNEWVNESGGKKTQIALCQERSNLCIKSVLRFLCLFILFKQVNYKVSSKAKNYALLLSPNNLNEAGKLLLQ